MPRHTVILIAANQRVNSLFVITFLLLKLGSDPRFAVPLSRRLVTTGIRAMKSGLKSGKGIASRSGVPGAARERDFRDKVPYDAVNEKEMQISFTVTAVTLVLRFLLHASC